MHNSDTAMLATKLFVLLLLCIFCAGQRQQWEAANYPNPTAGDWQRCSMRSRSLLCDPDAVLSENERNRLNYELGQLETRTRQDEAGRDFCQRKGISAAVALARRVRGGNEEALRTMANDMLRRWNIDAQCQKAVMVVMSAEDRTFWVARMPSVPIYGTELNDLFKAEREHFRAGRYAQGIQNVLRAIERVIMAKQQPAPGDGRSKGAPFQPSKPSRPEPSWGGGGGGRGGKGGGGGGSGLSWLLILAIIFLVVIPLLCCCCCLYFCCFRNKNSGGANANAGGGGVDPETGAGRGGGGRGRFGGLPLAGLMGGIGGAASNFFGKNRRSGAGGGVPSGGGGQPPPYYDPVPQHDQKGGAGGKGLYPNAPVKDEGGGGSW